ncbi:MAG: hypothetical protein K1X89_20170 [Myxococcaceae bacterium]|nr:hypothetical protein [Myxococcaceae bacterium]
MPRSFRLLLLTSSVAACTSSPDAKATATLQKQVSAVLPGASVALVDGRVQVSHDGKSVSLDVSLLEDCKANDCAIATAAAVSAVKAAPAR